MPSWRIPPETFSTGKFSTSPAISDWKSQCDSITPKWTRTGPSRNPQMPKCKTSLFATLIDPNLSQVHSVLGLLLLDRSLLCAVWLHSWVNFLQFSHSPLDDNHCRSHPRSTCANNGPYWTCSVEPSWHGGMGDGVPFDFFFAFLIFDSFFFFSRDKTVLRSHSTAVVE